MKVCSKTKYYYNVRSRTCTKPDTKIQTLQLPKNKDSGIQSQTPRVLHVLEKLLRHKLWLLIFLEFICAIDANQIERLEVVASSRRLVTSCSQLVILEALKIPCASDSSQPTTREGKIKG
ncbi:hypothetical protein V6N12_002874 [Hibiscus sabdariffa]|uniref:Uncharacterized protein n=1 Tax=Hibiscus sabdariffa TaxID=183260 RepID=A0ABR2EA97_9ROSI